MALVITRRSRPAAVAAYMKALLMLGSVAILITCNAQQLLVGATVLPLPGVPLKSSFNITMYEQYVDNATVGSPATAKAIFGLPVSSTGSDLFASIVVLDNKLTQTAAPNSAELGRLRGIYVVDALDGSSLLRASTIQFTAGPYSGSSLAFIGQFALQIAPPPSLLPIVGGTNALQGARGTVVFEIVSFVGLNGVARLTAVVELGP